jgi:NAD(P)H dehydrogenase (quinone)
LTHVVLRNSWYTENYTAQIPAILQRGELAGSAGDGRVSAATRADYAAAAAAVLAGEGQDKVYELGGDQAFTLAELAAELSTQADRPVSYRDLPEAEYARLLADAGLPEPAAAILADADRGLARGDLYVDSGQLRQLIGRPTTTLRDTVAAALS